MSTKLGAIQTNLNHLMKKGCIIGFKVALAEPNQRYEVFTQNEATDPDTINVLIVAEATCIQSLKSIQKILNDDIAASLKPRKTLRNDRFTMLVSFRGHEAPAN